MKIYISIFLATSLFIACGNDSQVDLEKERQAILKIHNAQRDNHFAKDSVAFINQLSENFLSVNRGEITTPSKEEMLAKYHGYFSSVEFVRWDDVSEPIIKFSEDATLAYSVVDKIVEVKYTDEDGMEQRSSSHYAWTAIYKKYGDEWKTDCVTSTTRAE